jgi:thioredoxin-related protein
MRRISYSMRTVVILVCVLAATATAVRAGDVPWRHNIGRAVREAKRRGRPIFVQVGSPGCVWCRKLENSTLQNPEVCRLLTERFIPVKVDGSEDKETVQELGIRSYPTLLMASPDGTLLEKREGYVGTREFIRRLNRTLDRVESESDETTADN